MYLSPHSSTLITVPLGILAITFLVVEEDLEERRFTKEPFF